MRERRPGDWRIDLAQRHLVEGLVGQAIDDHPALTRLTTSTSSFDRLDFQLLGPGERLCELELKTKRQSYRDWAKLRPQTDERNLFILDELALRKIIDGGRYAFLLVRDVPSNRWIVWTTMDLVLASKTRVDRKLATGIDRAKAKVLIDMTECPQHHLQLPSALSAMASSLNVIDRHWSDIRAWPSKRPAPLVGATR